MKKSDINYIWTDKKRSIFGLPISFTRYFLTETKLITRKGFLSVDEDEIELYRVTDKKLVLPLGQRMFKCGSVLIHVKDVDTPIKNVEKIKQPRKFMELLDKYININKDKYNIRGRDMMGPEEHHDEFNNFEDFDDSNDY